MRKIFLLCAVLSALLSPRSWAQGLPQFAVRKVGPLFDASAYPAMLGQEGVYSIKLEKGDSAWVFREAWIGEKPQRGSASYLAAVTSAGAVSLSTQAAVLSSSFTFFTDASGYPSPILPYDRLENQSTRRLWPQHGILIGDNIWLFYSIVQRFGTHSGDLAFIGQGLSWSKKPKGPFKRMKFGGAFSMWGDMQPSFGSWILRGDDGWLYAYGRALAEPGKYALYLARVREKDIAVKSSWRYYSSTGEKPSWTSDIISAAPLFEGVPGDISVSKNAFLDRYLMIYSDSDERRIVMRVAPAPWGPWGAPEEIFSCGAPDRKTYCAGAKEHPQLAAQNGRKVYFTVTAPRGSAPVLYEIEFNSAPAQQGPAEAR